jgi:hypothetical protein
LAASAAHESAAQIGIWDCRDDLAEIGITYQERIAEVLLRSEPQSTNAPDWIQVVVLPSFEPEWAITIRLDNRMCEYRVADRQVWEANWVPLTDSDGKERRVWSEDPIMVPISVRSMLLSADTVSTLEGVWRTTLGRLDFSKDIGCDGTIYRFRLGSSKACGEAWSPFGDTIAGRLVQLAGLLRRLATEETVENQKRLQMELRLNAEDLRRSLDEDKPR